MAVCFENQKKRRNLRRFFYDHINDTMRHTPS